MLFKFLPCGALNTIRWITNYITIIRDKHIKSNPFTQLTFASICWLIHKAETGMFMCWRIMLVWSRRWYNGMGVIIAEINQTSSHKREHTSPVHIPNRSMWANWYILYKKAANPGGWLCINALFINGRSSSGNEWAPFETLLLWDEKARWTERPH